MFRTPVLRKGLDTQKNRMARLDNKITIRLDKPSIMKILHDEGMLTNSEYNAIHNESVYIIHRTKKGPEHPDNMFPDKVANILKDIRKMETFKDNIVEIKLTLEPDDIEKIIEKKEEFKEHNITIPAVIMFGSIVVITIKTLFS